MMSKARQEFKAAAPSSIRCAIYTRNHVDERRACRQYILAQNGWEIAGEFHDAEASGATLDRPALQKLLTAIDAGKVDKIVVPRITHLTRRLDLISPILDRFTTPLLSHIIAVAPEGGIRLLPDIYRLYGLLVHCLDESEAYGRTTHGKAIRRR